MNGKVSLRICGNGGCGTHGCTANLILILSASTLLCLLIFQDPWLSAYTHPLHGPPKKKDECLFCDLCNPCKKPWSCIIIFSMTMASEEGKNLWQIHE